MTLPLSFPIQLDVQARGAYRQRTPSRCDVKDSLSLRLLGYVVES